MLPRSLTNLTTVTTMNTSSTCLVTPSVTALSDPPPQFVDAHLLEYLMTEVMRTLTVSEQVATARRKEQERRIEEQVRGSLSNGTVIPISKPVTASTREEADEAVKARLDAMGFKVGWSMAERLARDRPRFPPAVNTNTTTSASSVAAASTASTPDQLETVKFVCKDLWIALYDKQIDNLRTNHRGVYVLQDNNFKPLGRLSGGVGESTQVGRKVALYLAFPCGVIRGALATLGLPCTVTAESSSLPQSTFSIKTIKTVTI